jgi:beta-galactosidase
MRNSGLLTGVSYYPERFSRSDWERDANLIKEAGFDFIRTGEFAWSRFEPSDGVFDFAWMDEAIGVFAEHGLKVILCTPTASPMPWMSAKHPDMVPVTENGQPFYPGERRHYCFNNPHFRFYADRITREMAKHYAGHPAIMGWQIDNEPGGEDFVCHCGVCRIVFQDWLKSKYGTLAELNRRWGGAFFSFEFTDWSEIPVPLGHNVRFFNPGFRKDYLLFYSDSMERFLLSQADILRAHIRGVPITTNRFTLFWTDKFDHGMDARLDVVSYDNYDLEPSLSAFHHDFYRSIHPDRRYWILEQHTGPRDFGMSPRHAVLQMAESFARGAELVCAFSWRQIRYGVEQDFYGVVESDGTPGDTWEAFREANRWLKEHGRVLAELRTRNQVAILHSYESSVIYRTMNAGIDYHRALYCNFYAPLFELGLGADFVRSPDDLSGYRMLLIPFHICERPAEDIRKLERFVESGGTIVVTGDFMLKTKDNWRTSRDERQPLERLTGLRLDKWLTIPRELHVEAGTEWGDEKAEIRGFFQKFAVADEARVRVLARVDEPARERGIPAIAERRLGGGSVLFLAGICEPPLLKKILRDAAARQGISVLDLPEHVACIPLYAGEELRAYFAMNTGGKPVTLQLPVRRGPTDLNALDFAVEFVDGTSVRHQGAGE